MKSQTTYEWGIESVDKHGDIQDNWFEPKLTSYTIYEVQQDLLNSTISGDGLTQRLCLLRNYGNNQDGLKTRYYAYTAVVDGKLSLPDKFEDKYVIPDRYRNELAKWQEKQL